MKKTKEIIIDLSDVEYLYGYYKLLIEKKCFVMLKNFRNRKFFLHGQLNNKRIEKTAD